MNWLGIIRLIIAVLMAIVSDQTAEQTMKRVPHARVDPPNDGDTQ